MIKLIEEKLKKIIIVGEIFESISRDGEDNKILECALVDKVNYLVTCDEDLLSLKLSSEEQSSLGVFKGIKVMSQNEYLKIH